jgi:hypothetical protein
MFISLFGTPLFSTLYYGMVIQARPISIIPNPKSKTGMTGCVTTMCHNRGLSQGLWPLLWYSFLIKNPANSLRNRTI